MTTAAAPPSLALDRSIARRWAPESGAWLVVVLGLGLLVFLPSILSPLVLDDYLHASMVRGTFPSHRGIFDLYDFVSDADRTLLIDRGVLPWWTHPAFTIRFFRPLSSALLWCSHKAFHDHPVLLHLPPLLLWAASVLGVRRLYSRRLSPRVTLLATVIFALGAWHAIPLGWLANGEALVSLSLGILALDQELLWRDGKGLRHAAMATALFALALLGGEYALCLGGYCLGFEMTRERKEGDGGGGVGLVPFGLPAFAYLTVRGALHYGSFGSGFYADPLHDPVAYLRLAPLRISALLADGWLTIPSDSWGFGDGRWAAPVIVLLAAVPLGYLVKTVRARLAADVRRTLVFFLVGSLLAVVPVASVVPAARLLGASAIGLSAIVAVLLDEAWFARRPEGAVPRRQRELLGAVTTLLGFAHLVHGPMTAFLAAKQMRTTAVDFIAHTEWLRDRIKDPEATDVMVVRAGGGMFFGPFAVDADGRPPARWRTLSHTGHAMVLRKSARSLEVITPQGQGVFPVADGNLFRTPDRPLGVGDEVRVPGMRARIVAMGTAGPTRVRFDFDKDLESPEFVWTAEDAVGFHSVEPPKVGFGAPFDP